MKITKHLVPPVYYSHHSQQITDQAFQHRAIMILVMVVLWVAPLLLLKMGGRSGDGEGGGESPGPRAVVPYILWVIITSVAVVLVFDNVIWP